jgi:hypothetical protein
MASATWGTPATESSNLAGTALNGLTNTSSANTGTDYDNSSNRALYAILRVELGSVTVPAGGGSITVRINPLIGGNAGGNLASNGDAYTYSFPAGTGALRAILPVRLFPFVCRLTVTNNLGVTLAGSGNEVYVTRYGEDIS